MHAVSRSFIVNESACTVRYNRRDSGNIYTAWFAVGKDNIREHKRSVSSICLYHKGCTIRDFTLTHHIRVENGPYSHLRKRKIGARCDARRFIRLRNSRLCNIYYTLTLRVFSI